MKDKRASASSGDLVSAVDPALDCSSLESKESVLQPDSRTPACKLSSERQREGAGEGGTTLDSPLRHFAAIRHVLELRRRKCDGGDKEDEGEQSLERDLSSACSLRNLRRLAGCRRCGRGPSVCSSLDVSCMSPDELSSRRRQMAVPTPKSILRPRTRLGPRKHAEEARRVLT